MSDNNIINLPDAKVELTSKKLNELIDRLELKNISCEEIEKTHLQHKYLCIVRLLFKIDKNRKLDKDLQDQLVWDQMKDVLREIKQQKENFEEWFDNLQ